MIRKMNANELDQVMQIWLQSNIDAHNFIPVNYWEGNYDLVKTMFPKADVYVYIDDDKLIGFIGIMDTYIAGIFVDKKVRSKGVGKQLLDYAKEIHHELTLHAYRQNERAVAFYEREGFKVINEDMDEKTSQREVEMEWKAK